MSYSYANLDMEMLEAAQALMMLRYGNQPFQYIFMTPHSTKLVHTGPSCVPSIANKIIPSERYNACPRRNVIKRTSNSRYSSSSNEDSHNSGDQMVPIGEGRAKIRKSTLLKIKNKDYRYATRMLLMDVFTRDTLANSSLSGKPSPAFPGRAVKAQLDPRKVADIFTYISKNHPDCDMSSIKLSITTKCADECKMARNRKKKEKENFYTDKEV